MKAIDRFQAERLVELRKAISQMDDEIAAMQEHVRKADAGEHPEEDCHLCRILDCLFDMTFPLREAATRLDRALEQRP